MTNEPPTINALKFKKWPTQIKVSWIAEIRGRYIWQITTDSGQSQWFYVTPAIYRQIKRMGKFKDSPVTREKRQLSAGPSRQLSPTVFLKITVVEAGHSEPERRQGRDPISVYTETPDGRRRMLYPPPQAAPRY